MDAEEWRSRTGPWVRARMPDEQELDVIITKWIRAKDGQWWAECEAILPARHESADGTTKGVGAPTPISVSAEDIAPIPGETYSALPRDGAVAGRQWALEKLHQYGDEEPNRRLHRRDCWQARDSHTRVTTEEAAEMIGAPLVAICDVCRPDRALRRLRGAALALASAASPYPWEIIRSTRGCADARSDRPVHPAGRQHVSPQTAPGAVRPLSPPSPP